MATHSWMTASTHDGRSCLSRWPGLTLTQVHSSSPSALRLIRDNGIALYNRVSVQGYEECQSDILAVSAIAEDIRDALLEYQVSCEESHAAVVSLKFGCFNRRSGNG